MLFRTAFALLAVLPAAVLAQDASASIPSGAVVDPPPVTSFPPAESFPPEISAVTPPPPSGTIVTDPIRTTPLPDVSGIPTIQPNITGSATIQPIGTFAPTPSPSTPAVAAGNDSIPEVLVPYVQKYLSNISFYFPKKGDWWVTAPNATHPNFFWLKGAGLLNATVETNATLVNGTDGLNGTVQNNVTVDGNTTTVDGNHTAELNTTVGHNATVEGNHTVELNGTDFNGTFNGTATIDNHTVEVNTTIEANGTVVEVNSTAVVNGSQHNTTITGTNGTVGINGTDANTTVLHYKYRVTLRNNDTTLLPLPRTIVYGAGKVEYNATEFELPSNFSYPLETQSSAPAGKGYFLHAEFTDAQRQTLAIIVSDAFEIRNGTNTTYPHDYSPSNKTVEASRSAAFVTASPGFVGVGGLVTLAAVALAVVA
ncbi:uncharacterized protein LOC62_04G006387 [Vanrija pseudolonga]|uniref:Uncharacterized protein n=1 Tax=Vanrija pseudolonga TaxID=143232 RepID=A0AAF0YBG4_9TREE|nr:hypothetical protein LOC62_04G006387 [Vanrija pseudolonga]